MPADLTVTSIVLPSPLLAPCPLKILVSIKNIGNDPADPVPYDVTIDLGRGDFPDTRFETIVATSEYQRLTPGRTIQVPVKVQFPCTSPVILRATVDLQRQIPNNLRTAPSQTLPPLTPIPVPWLAVALRVGIRDVAGIVTFDPDGFCPGSAVVAEIVIKNKGCRASKPSTTEVTLEDANATPLTAVLASQADLVPALGPGLSHTATLSFATPNSPAGTSGTLGVRVSADAKFDNPDQCDRASLGAWIAKPFSAGAAPRLALTVGGAGVIRPGEVPTLSWSVRNDCTQIGTADVKILFGTPPTELHKTTLVIPLRTLVGEDLTPADLTIPMTIASTFWAVGVKSLELEVMGNGTGGGPYRISVPLNVIPESIDDTWWTWGMPPSAAWKSSYSVTGAFANRGLVSMTLTALTALEHPTDVVGTSEDATAAPLSFSTPAMPGASVSATFVRFQRWTWLAQGTFVEVGPTSRTFSYVANFSVTDIFGNAYPMILSAPTLVTVTVSGAKQRKRTDGMGMISMGLVFLAAAAVAAVVGGYPTGAIVAVVIAAGGMALIIAGTLYLYDAYDPPIPDFRDHEAVLSDPRAWNVPGVDDDTLLPLRTLALLFARVVSAQVRANHHKYRAWATFVDRDEPAWRQHRDAARDELETLRRLVPATVNAADEAHEKWEQLLGEVRSLPTPERLREITRRFADELGLIDKERALIDERLENLDERELRQALERTQAEGLRTIAELVRRIHETMASEFAECEYLR